jgi:membrane-bound ClpP family serine protease
MTVFPLICVFSLLVFVAIGILASSVKVVPEDKRLIVHRLGRRLGELGPGLVLVIPFIDRWTMKDVGDQSSGIPRDEQIGEGVGKAVTDVYRDGEIEINGVRWDAVSDEFIRAGDKVRVKRVIIEVERE